MPMTTRVRIAIESSAGDDQYSAADNDDHAGEHLPAACGQVVEGQRRGEQGEPTEQPADADPQGQKQDRLDFVAEAEEPHWLPSVDPGDSIVNQREETQQGKSTGRPGGWRRWAESWRGRFARR